MCLVERLTFERHGWWLSVCSGKLSGLQGASLRPKEGHQDPLSFWGAVKCIAHVRFLQGSFTGHRNQWWFTMTPSPVAVYKLLLLCCFRFWMLWSACNQENLSVGGLFLITHSTITVKNVKLAFGHPETAFSVLFLCREFTPPLFSCDPPPWTWAFKSKNEEGQGGWNLKKKTWCLGFSCVQVHQAVSKPLATEFQELV